jgi:hypothetical protein
MSLPSTLPMKLTWPAACAARSSLPGAADGLAALDDLFADVQQADGRLVRSPSPCIAAASAAPITANCSRCSAVQSTLAPRSSTVVVPIGLVGHGVGDGGAFDAFHRLQHVAGHGHQGTGVAG